MAFLFSARLSSRTKLMRFTVSWMLGSHLSPNDGIQAWVVQMLYLCQSKVLHVPQSREDSLYDKVMIQSHYRCPLFLCIVPSRYMCVGYVPKCNVALTKSIDQLMYDESELQQYW